MNSRPAVDRDGFVPERGLVSEDLPATFVPLHGVDLLALGVVVTAQAGPLPGHNVGGQDDLPQYESQAGAQEEVEEEEEEEERAGAGHPSGAGSADCLEAAGLVSPGLSLPPSCLASNSWLPQLSWNNSHLVFPLFSEPNPGLDLGQSNQP